MRAIDVDKQLSEMASGECRWIGDEAVHVYCHWPARFDALGTRVDPKYCVVTPTAEYGDWVTFDQAVLEIVNQVEYLQGGGKK